MTEQDARPIGEFRAFVESEFGPVSPLLREAIDELETVVGFNVWKVLAVQGSLTRRRARGPGAINPEQMSSVRNHIGPEAGYPLGRGIARSAALAEGQLRSYIKLLEDQFGLISDPSEDAPTPFIDFETGLVTVASSGGRRPTFLRAVSGALQSIFERERPRPSSRERRERSSRALGVFFPDEYTTPEPGGRLDKTLGNALDDLI